MHDFTKVYRIGTSRTPRGRAYSIYVQAKYNGTRLSITGVEGPTQGGNALGSCGQIDMGLGCHGIPINPTPGWTMDKINRLLAIWKRWHLNDMRAGCEHQQQHKNVDKGPIGAVCAQCGWVYGHGWKLEVVPEDVLQELVAFPDTDRQPAWI